MAKNKSLKKQNARLRQENARIKESMDSSMDSTYTSPSAGWFNADNGFGPDSDPTFGTIWLPPYEFTFSELTNLYQNPLIYRVINLHANDRTRKGFELTSEENNELARDIHSEMNDRFNWLALGKKMIGLRHLYGGGVLYVDIDDGRQPDEPLNENRVRKVWSFYPVESFYAQPRSTRPLLRDEKPGQPMHYQITLQTYGESKTFLCHESRLIRFPSYESDDVLSQNQRIMRRTWPFSTVQLIYDAVKRYGIGMQSESSLLQGFVEEVFKVSGLKNFKDLAGFRDFIREQRLLRSSLKATVIGQDDELQKIATPTTGMGEITRDQRIDIGMVTAIPVPIIYSEESGSLGGSTLSESRKVWFDNVKSFQETQDEPMFHKMMWFVSLGQGWDISDIGFQWCPLQELTPLEEAELRDKVADADTKYEAMGMNATDILDKRFGGDKYSMEAPDFDREEHEKMLEELDKAEEEQARKELEAMQVRETPEPEENTISIEDDED